MARINGVTESENNDVRQILEEQRKRDGFVSNSAHIRFEADNPQRSPSPRARYSRVRTYLTGAPESCLRQDCQHQWLPVLN